MMSSETWTADFVIVGTGAGGATAARVLSDAGFEVLMIEEGFPVPLETRRESFVKVMAQSFRDLGTTATSGAHPIPILQGRCVGGTTAINSGIIWRLPSDVRQAWRHDFGLSELMDDTKLDQTFETIERELHVDPTASAVIGENARLMAKGAEALGLGGKPTSRNARSCQGSARCIQGCATGARQSMDVSYVPAAIAKGATLKTSCRADHILIKGKQALGVTGYIMTTPKRRFTAIARRAVIVAGGAIQTPLLLRRSGLRGRVGDGFMSHPGSAVVGRFAERVGMGFGATQGYEVPLRERGYKLESLALPPEMLAARLPGAGPVWQERLRALGHYAQWCVQVRMKAVGKVRASLLDGSAKVSYEPTLDDLFRLREALTLLCKMMFAAGALEVYPGIAGVPAVLTRIEDVKQVEQAPLALSSYRLIASHLFGTVGAGACRSRHVLGPWLESHAVKRLYVMDGSALPTNLGVNPQHTIMAMAWRASERLANQAA